MSFKKVDMDLKVTFGRVKMDQRVRFGRVGMNTGVARTFQQAGPNMNI